MALRRLGSDGQNILSLAQAAKTLASEACPPDVARGVAGAAAASATVSAEVMEAG